LRIDGDSPEVELVRSPQDPNGDLSAVECKQFFH
jgi:hypothetical protein